MERHEVLFSWGRDTVRHQLERRRQTLCEPIQVIQQRDGSSKKVPKENAGNKKHSHRKGSKTLTGPSVDQTQTEGFTVGMQGWFTLQKSTHVIHQISRKVYAYLSRCRKILGQIQYSFIIKTPRKTRNKSVALGSIYTRLQNCGIPQGVLRFYFQEVVAALQF